VEQLKIDNVESELSAIAHKHAHVSFALIGIVVLVLALMGAGGYAALRLFEHALDKQDAKYDTFLANQKTMQEQIAKDAQTIAEISRSQQQKVVVIHDRDQKADTQIVDVTRADKTTEQVAIDFSAQFGYRPQIVGETFQFTQPQTQGFTALKIDRDRLFLDYGNEKELYSQEQSKTALLQNDVGHLQKDVTEANKQIEGYRKLAHRGKWKKIGEGAVKVGIFAAGVYIGSKVKKSR
jgi:cell division protein FtsB